jgi:hypothetical protein
MKVKEMIREEIKVPIPAVYVNANKVVLFFKLNFEDQQ